MKRFVVMSANIAARKDVLQMLRKCRIDGHQVLERTMLGALFDHHDLAVALDDLCLDLADGFV
ncbi:MAG TPA: hypothetical protein VFA65_12695 [Bryobacteraceae bacterium]|nr:hypothetical protein [Bryobacteraceae bacterium]